MVHLAASLPLQGERRIITALLADVKGSTALAGQIDVETWVEIMNRVFQVLGAEIYRYGGEIDQYRGDGLVAFFGATAAHEDDPERAVQAGLAMQAAIGHYAAQLLEEQGLELSLRVGLNTGEVIAASVGDSHVHRENTAMGRAIALAARMETACEPGTVLVSEGTYRRAERAFAWEALGEIAVKGFDQPVAVYRPLAAVAHPGKGRGIPGLASPLVGRDLEVEALGEALARLRSGIGGIVTLVGEAGIGKSRLVTEIRKSVLPEGSPDLPSPSDLRSDLQWIEGRCLSYATGVTYHLWLDMLCVWLGVAPDASPVAVRETLRERVQALCPDCLDDVYPYLGRLLSLPLEEDVEARLCGLDGESVQFLTFRAVERALANAAAQRPLVVVCEDLHWADPSSLALLERLLPATERVPLLYICVFRPLREHGCWQIKELAARDYAHSHTDLWLEPLSSVESAALVGHLLHVEALPERLRTRILDRAEGNPFFVEEILRSLIEGGIVVHDEATGHWRATRAESSDSGNEIPIPDTLHGVLSARIDRLPQETRRVLQQAAVLGRIFTYPLLSAVADLPVPKESGTGDLDAQLVILRRAQLIRERARLPEREYAFKHVLTQDAAYQGLLRRERRALHRRAAEALERLYPDCGSPGRGEEQLALLAHHWEQADESERAFEYLGRAGAQAAAHFANQEAVAYLSRALDLVPGVALAERYTLLLARERVCDLLGARDAQRQDLAALAALAETLGDLGWQADVSLRRAHLASRTQDYAAAEKAARDAIRRAENAQDVARQAAAYRELGRALRYQGDRDAARVELDRALLLARAAGSRRVEVDVLHELAAAIGPENTEAEPYLVDQLRICREMGYRRDEGRALRDLGLGFLYRAEYTKAIPYFSESLQVSRETGNRRDEGWALHCLATVYGDLGDHAQAHAYSEQALRVHDETGDRLGRRLASTVHCRADAYAGDYAGARACIEQARDMAERVVEWFLGDLALDQGDRPAARIHYEEALRLSGAESGTRCGVLCGLARLALQEGDLPQAEECAQEILRGLNARRLRWTGTLLGLTPYSVCYRVLRASKDPRAQEVLEEAYRLLRTRAETIDDPALRRSYLENVAANREIAVAWEAGSQSP